MSFRPRGLPAICAVGQKHTRPKRNAGSKSRKGRDMISKCANPQCNASLLRLSEGKVFQFEARQIVTLREASYPKGHQVAHFWLCGKCLTFMTLGVRDGAVEIQPLQR